MPKLKPPFKLNVPMLLTWMRIAMIPLVIGIFYLPETWMTMGTKNATAMLMFVIAAITDMIARAKAKGVYCGMMGFDGKDSRYWLDKGADYVCALSDVGLFFEVCKKTMREINE